MGPPAMMAANALGLRRRVSPYLWFLPAFAVLGSVLVYPWIWSLYVSFHEWSVAVQDAPSWVGVANYRTILTDRLFYASLQNSIVLVVSSVALQLLLG